MVTDAILNWWFGLIETVINGMPTTAMPRNVMDFGWIRDMNYFLPVSEMFGLFSVFFALGGSLLGSSLIVWWFVGVLRGGATKA
jgi:hypothetical protein